MHEHPRRVSPLKAYLCCSFPVVDVLREKKVHGQELVWARTVKISQLKRFCMIVIQVLELSRTVKCFL